MKNKKQKGRRKEKANLKSLNRHKRLIRKFKEELKEQGEQTLLGEQLG